MRSGQIAPADGVERSGDQPWGAGNVVFVTKGNSMRRSTTIVTALAGLVVGGALAIPAGVAGATAPVTLFVSPTANIHLNNNHHNCATAGDNSVPAAGTAA